MCRVYFTAVIYAVPVLQFAKMDLKLPGMLIIDTPGHESFRYIQRFSVCYNKILETLNLAKVKGLQRRPISV